MKTSTCKGCGATIVWATNPATGKKIPLHIVPIYLIVELPSGECEAIRTDEPYAVNHFVTCPKANQFNRSSK